MTNHCRSSSRSFAFLSFVSALVALALSCGGGQSPSNGGQGSGAQLSVSISPSFVTVQAGESQQFTATVAGSSNQDVSWQVADFINGLVKAVGTISAKVFTQHLRSVQVSTSLR